MPKKTNIKESIKRLTARSPNSSFTDVFEGTYLYGSEPGTLTGYSSSSSKSPTVVSPVVSMGGKPFRYPTERHRFVRRFNKVLSSRTNRSLAWSVPGSNTTGMILLSNLASYWTNTSVVLDSNILNESSVKALNKIGQRKTSIGVSMGESLAASSMLVDTALTMIRAMLAAKKGNWRQVQSVLGLTKSTVLTGLYPANKWLEYQYGWKPLLSDLFDQYKVLCDGLAKDNFLVYGSGGAHRKAVVKDETYDTVHRIYYSRERIGEQICITRLIGRLRSSKWRNAAQIGIVNPLEVGWELVPFSFVIDWFMPIGNVLEALTARAGLDFVTGSRTFITGGSARLQATHTSGNILYQKGDVLIDVFFHDRFRLYDWPMPTYYASESPFTTSRSLNALALWRALLGGSIPAHIRS